MATPLAVIVGETLPHCAAEHDTVHATPEFAESFNTVAMSCIAAPGCTVAEAGATVTLIAAAGIVTDTESDFEGSATDVAVRSTISVCIGAAEGAV